uniref:Uncharacterized protein n=1 Tax=Chenopodium quinoa TaxID=63459 RepID=A0A803LM36_CHEQI
MSSELSEEAHLSQPLLRLHNLLEITPRILLSLVVILATVVGKIKVKVVVARERAHVLLLLAGTSSSNSNLPSSNAGPRHPNSSSSKGRGGCSPIPGSIGTKDLRQPRSVLTPHRALPTCGNPSPAAGCLRSTLPRNAALQHQTTPFLPAFAATAQQLLPGCGLFPVPAASTQQPFPSFPPSSLPTSYPMVIRSKHGIVKPNLKYKDKALHTSSSISPIPKNPVNAIRDHNWKIAIWEDYDALIENGSWDLFPRPPNMNIIRSLYIFWHKTKSDGSFERHMARLVGDGKT